MVHKLLRLRIAYHHRRCWDRSGGWVLHRGEGTSASKLVLINLGFGADGGTLNWDFLICMIVLYFGGLVHADI